MTREPRPLHRVLCLLMLVLPVAAPAAQGEAEAGERPRVGLVLGGGGARGAAHIGVLRELERLRVPIDAIAGTSMGAIVGGLYASGKTPAELEDIVASLDWAGSLRDRPPRRDLPFRRKQDDAAFPIRFELGVRDGKLRLPRGLVQGQRLGYILRELTEETAGITDFDELPIPFRAVASDIETGEAYVMGKGNLTEALRASMSVPGVFAPVVVDGRTLVDGGIVGNLPIDTIRGMGVDIIIAVDVEFPLYEPDQLETALDVSAQILTILIRKETRRQIESLGDDDILIRPKLEQFGSSNFADIVQAIDPGAVAAHNLATELGRLSLPPDDWRRHLAARRPGEVATPTIDFLRVADAGPLSARVLEAHLDTQPGDRLDPVQLADDAASLYGLNLYQRVDYNVVEEGGRTGVVFEPVPKAWGPNFLRFGLQLEDDFAGTTAFNLSTRLTRNGVNRLGAEWRTDLRIGTEPRLATEFYQPLSYDGQFFIAPRAEIGQRNLQTFQANDTVARYRLTESEVGIDAGRVLGRWGEFRVGAFRGTGNGDLKVGDPTLPNIDFNTGGLFGRFAVDTLDDAQFPQRGMLFDLEWLMSRPTLGGESDTDSLISSFTVVATHGRHSLMYGLDFATTIEADSAVQNFFPLGGFLRMSGLARGELSGPHAGVTRLVWYRRSGETGGTLFDVPLYVGASVEAGNVWQQRSDISTGSLLMNGSLFLGLDTYFGPLYVVAGLSEGGNSNFYLSLGALPR